MKKLCSLLLVFVLLFSLASPMSAAESAGYSLAGVEAFTVKSSASDAVRLTGAAEIAAFETMIGSAGSLVENPANASRLISITAESGGKTYTYTLLKKGESYYLLRGSRCRTMDIADFRAFLKSSGKLSGFSLTPGGRSGGRLQFTATGDETHLGEIVILKVEGANNTDPLATWTSNISFTRPPKFFRQADGSQLMLFPVAYTNDPGQHWVEVTCAGETARYTINAKDRQWQRQDLTVDPNTVQNTIGSDKANDEYERETSPLRGVADDKAHWSGRFILPCSDQRVTTQFGMVRYMNGEKTSVRHGALDLAMPTGTPVKASGGGRVLYSGFLQLTGNTVIIEHGYGLKTWYYHMDSRKVETGDMVDQGQQIGNVGSTGFATGAHLHFGMSVNNVYINPYTAIKTDLLADIGK